MVDSLSFIQHFIEITIITLHYHLVYITNAYIPDKHDLLVYLVVLISEDRFGLPALIEVQQQEA